MASRDLIPRRALQPLNMNIPLEMRAPVKRPPITFDQENEIDAAYGIAMGIYAESEIDAVTNARYNHPPGGIEEIEDSSLAEYYESFDAGDLEADAEVDNADWPVNRRFREALEEHGLDEDEDLDELIGDPDEDSQAEDDFDQTDHDKSELQDAAPVNLFDAAAMGLKEINNLAHFSVSSHKPGNGVEELLHDDLDKYWQSDGQQPHLLTIHFLRRVEIRAIRFYVDYSQDESYTPTFVVFSAGTGHHDLVEFASLPLSSPIGWQDIDLSNVGGGDDGRSLCCWIVQMQVKENHQNGKDTHIRGIKLYALDESVAGGAYEEGALREVEHLIDESPRRQRQQNAYHGLDEEDAELYFLSRSPGKASGDAGFGGMGIPDFMREPEIR